MDDAEIERWRNKNLERVIARAIESCTADTPEDDAELKFLLGGPHGKPIALGILEFPAPARHAVRRGAPLWLPFGGKEYLLYELVTDRSDLGLARVKNLLDAGWDPNIALPGTGRTALMQVVNNSTPANRAMVALLLTAGADTTQASASGLTVFDDAPTVMREFIRAALDDLHRDPTGRKRA
ncbi:MAG: hypothetical protein ACM3ZT_04810 [Bacillota bacterium]